jgi:broad specificity phosphatase PhoE
VYAFLPSVHALDYDVLKGSLLRRFDKTEDGFKQMFRACRPESGETFQQFAVRLVRFFNRWIEMSGIALKGP